MCYLPSKHNMIIFLLCLQFVLLALLVVLVTYRVVSFSEHLHHMSVLTLDMADAVDFLVSYDQIGARIILHIQALICLHTVLIHTISLLYHSIILLTNLLLFFIIHFEHTPQMVYVVPSNITNSKIVHYQCELNRYPHMSPQSWCLFDLVISMVA